MVGGEHERLARPVLARPVFGRPFIRSPVICRPVTRRPIIESGGDLEQAGVPDAAGPGLDALAGRRLGVEHLEAKVDVQRSSQGASVCCALGRLGVEAMVDVAGEQPAARASLVAAARGEQSEQSGGITAARERDDERCRSETGRIEGRERACAQAVERRGWMNRAGTRRIDGVEWWR